MTKNNFVLSNHVRLTLRQRGISNARISDLIDEYLQGVGSDEASPEDFYMFCLQNSQVQFSSRNSHNLFMCDWHPTYKSLNGIPDYVFAELLRSYRDQYSGCTYPAANLDLHFENFCHTRWNRDARNVRAGGPTFINKNWEPSESLVCELKNEGIAGEDIDELVPEFRLYWMERNEPRASWSGTFRWFVKSRSRNIGRISPKVMFS